MDSDAAMRRAPARSALRRAPWLRPCAEPIAAARGGRLLHLVVELLRQIDRLVSPHDGLAVDDDVDALGLRERFDLRRRLLEQILDQLGALAGEIALELDVDLLQLDEPLLEVLALLLVDLGLEDGFLLVE